MSQTLGSKRHHQGTPGADAITFLSTTAPAIGERLRSHIKPSDNPKLYSSARQTLSGCLVSPLSIQYCYLILTLSLSGLIFDTTQFLPFVKQASQVNCTINTSGQFPSTSELPSSRRSFQRTRVQYKASPNWLVLHSILLTLLLS